MKFLTITCLSIFVFGLIAVVQAGPAISAEQIDAYLSRYGSPLAGYGGAFMAAGKRYDVDPRFIVAIAGAESTFGTANCQDWSAESIHNAWGYLSNGICQPFNSWEKAIETVTWQIGAGDYYFTAGRYTIPEIGATYCGAGCTNWVDNVTFFYQEMGGDLNNLRFEGGGVAPSGMGRSAYLNSYQELQATNDGGQWFNLGPALKFEFSGQRFGYLSYDNNFLVQEGSLTGSSSFLSDGILDFELEGSWILALGNDGNLWGKEALLDEQWGLVANGPITSFQANGPRLGVLSSGVLSVKEGSLSAGWTTQTDAALWFQLEGSRIGYLRNTNEFYVKEGGLDAGWVLQTSNMAAYQMEGNRIAALDCAGQLSVKEGDLNAPWVSQTGGVSAFQLENNRVAVLDHSGNLSIKEGDLSAGWTLAAQGVQTFEMDGDRVLITQGSTAKVLAGSLSGAWQTVTDGASAAHIGSFAQRAVYPDAARCSGAAVPPVAAPPVGTPIIVEPAPPNGLPVGYQLPFPVGETWYLTSGPHDFYSGNVGCFAGDANCPDPSTWSSLDFAPLEVRGCPSEPLTQYWATASKAGEVIGIAGHWVTLYHSADGYYTHYAHLANIQVAVGQAVAQGQILGNPSCEGLANGVHVHFAVERVNEGFVPINGWTLSGWTFYRDEPPHHYYGYALKGSEEKYANVGRSDNEIYNDGVIATASDPVVQAPTTPPIIVIPNLPEAVTNPMIPASSSVPVFEYPLNGQEIGYDGSWLFRVYPVANASGYLWGFFQNGVNIWDNQRDEGHLGTNDYGIAPDSAAHSRIQPGSVEVWVRAMVNGQWTEPAIITITLK